MYHDCSFPNCGAKAGAEPISFCSRDFETTSLLYGWFIRTCWPRRQGTELDRPYLPGIRYSIAESIHLFLMKCTKCPEDPRQTGQSSPGLLVHSRAWVLHLVQEDQIISRHTTLDYISHPTDDQSVSFDKIYQAKLHLSVISNLFRTRSGSSSSRPQSNSCSYIVCHSLRGPFAALSLHHFHYLSINRGLNHIY